MPIFLFTRAPVFSILGLGGGAAAGLLGGGAVAGLLGGAVAGLLGRVLGGRGLGGRA